MSSWTGFGSACTDPTPCASPARDRSPVGNVGGAGSREPLQGLDGVCRRVSRGSARSLAHGAVCVPQTGCGDVGDGAICSVLVHTRLFDGAKVVFFSVAIRSEMEVLRPRRHNLLGSARSACDMFGGGPSVVF